MAYSAVAAASADDLHLALQNLVLTTLDKDGSVPDTKSLRVQNNQPVEQLSVLGVLNSLRSRDMVTYETIEKEIWHLTEEGAEIATNGSHEAKVLAAVPPGEEGVAIDELQKKVGAAVAKLGQGKAFQHKWINKNGTRLFRAVDSIVDQTQADLKTIRDTTSHPNAAILKELRKRKLCDAKKVHSYKVSKGPKFALKVEKQATEIDYEMLQSGAWRNATFKKYNFDAVAPPPQGGHLHPLMKVREEFRIIFFEMGFTEMPTNKFVESSFWNFDALFQPQQHPARDMHDTFFLKGRIGDSVYPEFDPATANKFPKDYCERVKKVHSVGGYGSAGYGMDWKVKEAEKLLLRTHTTAVSSNMLYHLAKEKEFKPAKFFSIDRVFRNETVDATHLAEFHQVEGLVVDRGLTLGDLIGVLDVFFKKLGVKNIRFKPAYNPYTEPSMEIFSYHHGLGKWVEIGNSGMFRPEMLRPMCLPEDVQVIAWGLSLERPTMIKYGIDDIRTLLGHRVDLEMIKKNPVVRLYADEKQGASTG